MELREWQYMNKPAGSAASNSSSGYKKRFEKLIKYHIDHASSELESITKKDIKDDGFWLSEHYNNSHHEFDRDLIVSYDKDSDTFFFRIFIDGKEVDSILRNSYEEFVVAAEPYMFLPDGGTQEYDDLLTEALNEWKLMNHPTQQAQASAPTTTSSTKNYPDQTDRYKRLLAQIDSDKICKYTVNVLTDRILSITVDTKFKTGLTIKIVYKPYVPCYTLLVVGDNVKDFNDLTYEDILELLQAAAVINNTDLCESATSIADDFKLYENLWD